MKISLLVLTYNEESHISRLINNVKETFDDIVIVDSHSDDGTIDIINNHISTSKNIRVYLNKFISPNNQIDWAIKKINFKYDLIFKLDADELINDELKIFLEEYSNNKHSLKNFNGIAIKRKMFFQNKLLKWGGMDNIYVTRIFNKYHFKVEERLMDEHIFIKGKILKAKKGFILDKNLKSLDEYLIKHIKYSSSEAKEFTNPYKSNKEFKSHLNVILKKRLKYGLYYKLPFFLRSLFFFIYRYFLLLGFLDGRSGLIFHILNSFFYRFLVDIKIIQQRDL